MFSTHTQSTHWDTQVDSQQLEPNAKFVNMSNRPTSSMPTNESELVNDCRRALTDGKLKNPMDRIRLLCLSRGASGIYNLGRSFRRLASQGDKLSKDGFIEALQDVEIDCTPEEADEIFTAFDTEGTGHVDTKEFLFQLRLMSLAREALVHRCFKKTDRDNDDVITVDDLRRSYSVKHHPLYVNGDEDKETIMKRFLATFEEGGDLRAEITIEEFLNYYAGISATIEEDGYFDLLLREEYNL
ncbi:calcyphosin-like protein [Bradysia coprophila]|uniref:calcyphosin-like protein n=1 Tax=Bradysia coprophila TaxID=38358 RepID=UPI00187D7A58|nr:calcyphosin-like protein [Bradysia coprophila]